MSSVETTKTARLVKSDLPGFRGNASLYRCEPPMTDEDGNSVEYVIASAVHDEFVYECYLFPGSTDGHVADWGELPGSLQGTTDHVEAFRAAGYEVSA